MNAIAFAEPGAETTKATSVGCPAAQIFSCENVRSFCPARAVALLDGAGEPVATHGHRIDTHVNEQLHAVVERETDRMVGSGHGHGHRGIGRYRQTARA